MVKGWRIIKLVNNINVTYNISELLNNIFNLSLMCLKQTKLTFFPDFVTQKHNIKKKKNHFATSLVEKATTKKKR